MEWPDEWTTHESRHMSHRKSKLGKKRVAKCFSENSTDVYIKITQYPIHPFSMQLCSSWYCFSYNTLVQKVYQGLHKDVLAIKECIHHSHILYDCDDIHINLLDSTESLSRQTLWIFPDYWFFSLKHVIIILNVWYVCVIWENYFKWRKCIAKD